MVVSEFHQSIGDTIPRIIMGQDQEPRPVFPDLVTALAAELQYNRPTGQPVIREQRFPQTEAIRTTVIWDRWEHLTDEQRVEVILQAYEEVEGEAFRNRLALAIGLTVPEAHDAGLLPFEVITALRTTDTVSPEQCKQAMVEMGASVLSNRERPTLRFATSQEAEQCVRLLVERLPQSAPVWVISQEVARIVE